MVDKHSQSFFGQSTGMTILSSSRKDPYLFFKCIQKKPDGKWEKPSSGEGKTIKCNLDEIIMILQVLKKHEKEWSSFHNFKDSKTQISFKWDDKDEKRLMIRVGKYSKVLTFSQVELLRLLLKHILKEKIAYATTSGPIGTNKFPKEKVNKPNESNDAKTSQIEGLIKSSTEKALLIQFKGENDVWIPKSTIKSNYELKDDLNQTFLIDEWILRRNNLISH